MSRYTFVLRNEAERQRAMRYVNAAPFGSRVEIKAAKRSLDQNSKFWASLTDLAEQVPWHGQRLRPDDWKLLILDALKRELRIIPNLDNNGFVNLGQSSSDLTKQEMSDAIELILEFGARHNVVFHDTETEAA